MNERWEPWALWGESVLGRGSGQCKGPEAGRFQRQPEGRSDENRVRQGWQEMCLERKAEPHVLGPFCFL